MHIAICIILKKYVNDLDDVEDILMWLGSNCGVFFLSEVLLLIKEYPFKYGCASAICLGEVCDKNIVDGHKKWIEEKMKNKK